MAEKEEVKEIAVKEEKKTIVSDAKDRIYFLFHVEVTLKVEFSGTQWVQLKGIKEDTEYAKNYINALCDPGVKTKVNFPVHLFGSISKYRDDLEKNCQAVVSFPSNNEAIVQGEGIAVAMASSAIEDRVNALQAGAIEASSSAQSIEQEKTQTAPVSRIDPSLKEFAIKLGYTEEVIQQVLKKQAGKEVDQNILLRELINVSSPSLLQKTRPTETIVPATNSPAVIPQRSEIIARGPPAQLRPMPRAWMPPDQSVQSSNWELPERINFIEKQEEEPLYHQVIGNSASVDTSSDLRHIVIDGSNVAMSHGNQQFFSCLGIKLCIEYFQQRGHNEITVFVPQWRKEATRPEYPIKNQEILFELEKQRHLVFTPSRKVNGRRIVCYDDRFILRLAHETDGVIVSNDNFRDLFRENPKWQEVIEQRILMYSFVNDRFMVPDDPLGRHGPNIDDFLRKGTASHKRICPYLKRCTYGLRCRYYHPERDPNRKELDSKRVPDRSRAQESSKAHGDPRHRVYPKASSYSSGNQYAYNSYTGMTGHYFHEGLVRGGPMDNERHLNASNPGLVDTTVFDNLRAIFVDAEELILQVMKDNPKASLEQLANIITNKLN